MILWLLESKCPRPKSCLFSTAEVTNNPSSLGGHWLVLRQEQTTKPVTNIKKPLVLWSSPWYKWPALISRIFWNSYTSNESALQAISNFQKIRQNTMVNSIRLKYAFYIVNSANFKKFVKSMQVIFTRDSTKVLKASICLPWIWTSSPGLHLSARSSSRQTVMDLGIEPRPTLLNFSCTFISWESLNVQTGLLFSPSMTSLIAPIWEHSEHLAGIGQALCCSGSAGTIVTFLHFPHS